MDSNADMLRMLIAKRYALRTHLHNNRIIYVSFGIYGAISCSVDTQWKLLDERLKSKLMECVMAESQ